MGLRCPLTVIGTKTLESSVKPSSAEVFSEGACMKRHPQRILLIEDDPDLREILHHVLLEEGYEATVASSLEAGRHLVQNGTFHLIVTDSFRHLDLDPLASVEELRLLAQPTPVGLMTAWPVS